MKISDLSLSHIFSNFYNNKLKCVQPLLRSFSSRGLPKTRHHRARLGNKGDAMNTKQRTALVTGGNRGLGAAIAHALHDRR